MSSLDFFSNAEFEQLDLASALSLGGCGRSHTVLILTSQFCNLGALIHLGKLLLYAAP